MKKFFFTLSAAIMALLSFTSCDSDEMRGMDLSGEWRGDFDMYYDYYCHYHHETERYFADETYIEFMPYSGTYTAGTGRQVDFYDDPDSPYDEVYHYFKWEITNGYIHLYYRDEHEWDTTLRDYHLSSNHFRGYFGNTNNRFDLIKLTDYRWNTGYESDGYYYHYREGYLAPTRAGEAVDTTATEMPMVIHYGNASIDGVK